MPGDGTGIATLYEQDRAAMPDLAAVEDAIATARAAVATDVTNVAAAIDAAVTDIDQQLALLHERRERLETALAAVNAQIADVDAHREALTAARAQAPADTGQRAAEATSPDASEAEGEYLEFTEEELDPAVARTERILTVLTRAQYPMAAAEINDILNEFGDDTTSKVVSGTISSLRRRSAVTKTGPGLYAAT